MQVLQIDQGFIFFYTGCWHFHWWSKIVMAVVDEEVVGGWEREVWDRKMVSVCKRDWEREQMQIRLCIFVIFLQCLGYAAPLPIPFSWLVHIMFFSATYMYCAWSSHTRDSLGTLEMYSLWVLLLVLNWSLCRNLHNLEVTCFCCEPSLTIHKGLPWRL